MYVYKNCRNVERIFARNTHQGYRYHFITANYQRGKYKNSPYFKGAILWNSFIPDYIILPPTLLEFKMCVKRLFFPFNDNLL